MSGLDNIISQIQKDSAGRAEEIIANAEKQAETILNAAKEEGHKKADIIISRANANAENEKKLAASKAELIERNAVLNAKIKSINAVLDKALAQLKEMSLLDYFSFIQKLAIANCQKGEGIMYLSPADLKRLPPSFEEALNDKLKKKQSVVTISKEPRNIDGGFILAFGDIEENCTFEALFASNREEFSDLVNTILFGQS